MKPAVFFDRDGIVNVPSPRGPYLLDADAFILCPGIIEAMRAAQDAGYSLAVVTNQKCIGKGLLSEASLTRIHGRMRQLLDAQGIHLLDIAWCGDLEDKAPRRKPQPGMLLELAERHALELSRSWMIGDQPRDIEAGQAAGCARTVLVSAQAHEIPADYHIDEVGQLAALFRAHLPPA